MDVKRYILPAVVAIGAAAIAVTVTPLSAREHRTDNAPIRPMIPNADRDDASRVFLEHADSLISRRGIDYQILCGNVEFRRGGMWMYCDSAHYYDVVGSFDAFGNVRMEQGDTLFVYGDILNYIAPDSLAILFADPGNEVRLINRDVELRTDKFYYDMRDDIGYYETGGVLTDANNRLSSREGEYSPSTKEAVFTDNVKLTSLTRTDTIRMFTDNLYYNTATHVALMSTLTYIYSHDGRIVANSGEYNTETTQSDLYDRSMVIARNGNTLTGDSIFYNRTLGFGEVYGNMELCDTTNKVILQGDYGFYNELTDSAFVTGRAVAIDYSQPDSLYVHGSTIRAFRIITLRDSFPPAPVLTDSVDVEVIDEAQIAEVKPIEIADTLRLVIGDPQVKFYRRDLQGMCDSLTVVSSDSTIRLNYLPVIWADNRQIFGDEMLIHLNDSTVDRITIPTGAFMSEEIEPDYYNQLGGKAMVATFANRRLRHLDVNGNVQVISYPEENDSTINKLVNLESSYMAADFRDNTIERMRLWPQTNASVTPLYLASRALMFLPAFVRYDEFRPLAPDDIFDFPQALIDLFDSRRGRNNDQDNP